MTFQAIESDAALEAVLSSSEPVWLFKHSLACGVSHMAHDEVQQYMDAAEKDVHIIAIQTHRPLSNKTADELSIVHKSPQIFLVKDGKALWNASHYSITAKNLQEAYESA